MIFCTRCRRLVPQGDYCPWCRSSWGASICQDCDHRNTPGVPSCVKCPGVNLSDAAIGIPLGWTATLLSGLALLGLIKLAIAYRNSLLSGATTGGTWILIGVFLIAPCAGELMRRLPGQGGYLSYRLRNLPMTAIDYAWSLSRALNDLLKHHKPLPPDSPLFSFGGLVGQVGAGVLLLALLGPLVLQLFTRERMQASALGLQSVYLAGLVGLDMASWLRAVRCLHLNPRRFTRVVVGRSRAALKRGREALKRSWEEAQTAAK